MRLLTAAALGLCLIPASALAVTPPASVGAGAAQRRSQEQQRQLEQSQRRQPLKGPVVVGPRGTTHKVGPGGPQFTLQRIVFNRSHFLKASRLQRLAKPYLHHPITLSKLYGLIDKVNAVYAKRGLITDRAVLPPQRITNGEVHIRLVEGRVGAIRFHSLQYTRPGYVLSRLPLKKGKVLDAAALERGLIYFDRTNNLALRASLKPGSRFGLSDVLLQAIEPPRYQLSLLVNNDGARSTGRLQGGFYGLVHGPLGRGDRLSLYAVKSQGAINANLGYQLPLTRSGLTLSLSASHNNIHIIDGPYQQLDVRGHANVGQIGLTQPLIATRRWKITTAASVSYTQDITDVGGVTLSDNQILTPGLGFTAEFTGRGHDFLLTQTAEHGHAHEVLGQTQDYWLFPASFSGSAQLHGPIFATLRGGWQYTSADQLPPSQLYQLGGADTIPGYPSGAVSGTSGYYAHAALHARLPGRMALGIGYGFGAVYALRPARKGLSSFDFELQGTLPRWKALAPVSWRIDLARPQRHILPDQSDWTFYFNIVAPINL